MARLLAYVTGMVNHELLLQVEILPPRTGFSGRMRQLGCGAPMRAVHLGGDRQEAGAESTVESIPRRQTGDHPRLVRETGGAEVRWLQVSLVPGPAKD